MFRSFGRVERAVLVAAAALLGPHPADALAQGGAQAETRRHAEWTAQWVAHPDAPPTAAGLFHFRRSFDLAAPPEHFVVRVSADNRYRLLVNGRSVASGPARGDVAHWRYETLDLAPWLRAGRNVIAASVWNWGEHRPAAQASHRTGFLLQGEGAAAAVSTGAGWRVLWNRGYGFAPVVGPDANGYYVASPGEVIDGRVMPWGWEQPGFDDSGWIAVRPVVLRADAAKGALPRGGHSYGEASEWQLVPRELPAMEETPVRFARVARSEGVAPDDRFLRGKGDLVVPANRRVSILLDQGHLTTAYPVVVASGGEGASMTLTYAEALFDAQGRKGNRNEIAGKTIRGVRDRILFDGGAQRRYQPLWFRTWRYVQLDVETGAAPLRLHDVHGIFTAYPFAQHAAFASDQPWITPIWDIDWRIFRLSAFETFWDTPYYEQFQYVGDTRIMSLISLYSDGDDRLMRNALIQIDQSRIPEGITASRYPSALPQYIPPFSLWWVAMVHDYWMHRDDPAFVRRFLPGVRGVLGWYEGFVDETGMLGPMPWWNVLDWASAYDRGVPPGAENGHSTPLTLQYAYALQRAAEIEEALGQPAEAARYRVRAEGLIAAVVARAWDARRGLFADTPDKSLFSQQTNSLAVLVGAVPDGEQAAVMERVLADPSLVQASYYFRFYVDEALVRAGLGGRYLERLAPWREMIRLGLTTTPENPEPTRSDSHAWSAHPNYHLLASVLGVRPASPGFRTVRIAPALGPLRRVHGIVPHPAGPIELRLRRSGGRLRGEVILPPGLSGRFEQDGQSVALRPGRQQVDLGAP
ncbi:alpha-L-rhamnosidase [Sphingomonas parva]|uniref:Alpha-L-rhamnosidase n=1 Tax=Sphingomonas parva TaxID=2555898 RepID=A0A4Y8ZUU9_9SPHN|nr:alpha-L-rhamnosidase C-terminal domain-containing protein [Sphingomonas parva]TFI59247.1 alpha-L-rhamnosidase [Sphingomonas parva]